MSINGVQISLLIAPPLLQIRPTTISRKARSIGIARQPYRELLSRHYLGRMSAVCVHCEALHWIDERVQRSSKSSPEFGLCCDHGKVQIPLLHAPPPALQALFEANGTQSDDFREHIRQYNMALAFTSVGVHDDQTVNQRRGPGRRGGVGWVFRILGQLSHLSGALETAPGQSARYAQLYIYDPRLALQQRMHANSNLREDTMKLLQNLLIEHHIYSPIYKHAYEILRDSDAPNIELRMRVMPGQDRRRYNLPTADEVSVILPGNEPTPDSRDIILRSRMPGEAGLYRIHDGNAAYACLHYVLLFPRGEHGWHSELRLIEPGKAEPKRLTQTRYIAYRVHARRNEYSTVLRGKRLFQQYLVDMWASADQNRLSFIRYHQANFRASLYSGLEDAITGGDIDLNDLGQRFVLPSSYIGGPRHMQQRFQDAMAMARYYRKVDLFVTMTANPEWVEIQQELLEHQVVYDRPDLVSRVFHLKLQALVDDIYKHGIFGEAVAYVYQIEFQKRGLPHAHLLIVLRDGHKILTTEDIDAIICAEWPDPETEPLLFETIRKCMIHGPCGALNPHSICMENGRCKKFYPKDFQPYTRMDNDGYPLYRRRDDGRAYQVGDHMLDNRWVIPYSPYLSAKYHCHINVECVATFKSIKYPFKYIHKGGDRATIEYQLDEIKQYIDGRYIEGAWRIFHFDLHEQIPNVVRLQVHLPGQHMVSFNPDEDAAAILQRAASERTTLTEFFKANSDTGALGAIARALTYQEFPQQLVFPAGEKRWTIRKQSFALERMYFVSPTAGERFYLRTLLTVVKGATSFEDLRTFQGTEYSTFREACIARGLLQDDGEWRACLAEAAEMQTGTRLRHLFATLLLFCNPSEPHLLWNEFRVHICDDLAHRLRQNHYTDSTDDDVYDYGLFLINEILEKSGYTLGNFAPMPLPQNDWNFSMQDPLISEQLNYNHEAERLTAIDHIAQLNTEQLDAYNQIVESVHSKLGLTFFLNGPGRTGKTFVYKTICHKLRSEGVIVLCVASSGIAALLLHGGRTAHSMFKIPIDGLNDDSFCNIPKESSRAELLRSTELIVWDEALMQHRNCPEALDRTLRDICNDTRPFAGKTIVFGGDFQQTLPVVPKGSQEDIVAASLPRSYLWRNIQTLHLRRNMRLEQATPEEVVFAEWLLDVGHGRDIAPDGTIKLRDNMGCPDIDSLIHAIYPDIDGPIPPPEYFLERIILAARNKDVHELNQNILDRMQGESYTFHSADTVVSERGADGVDEAIPLEYLRMLEASGLPPGELTVKLGCPLILLRNLSPGSGLCNGTRMTLVRVTRHILEVRILGGDRDGELAFIPRISLTPNSRSPDFAFSLKRFQFPVRLGFAISINKAQGQSVRTVGLNLEVPVFAHGQLYVALSRATSSRRVKVLLPHTVTNLRTHNVVYPEIFQN